MMNLALAQAVAVTSMSLGCSVDGASVAQRPFEGNFDVQLPGVLQATGMWGADFDRDGRRDLVTVSGSTARVKILLNGAAGFREFGELEARPSACGVALGDFDEDGTVDLAVCHHDTPVVLVFLGRGDGTFRSPKELRVAATKPHAHKVVAADANGDGHTDLLLPQADDNQLWVLLGDGRGEFSPSPQSPLRTGNHPYGVVAADFDADGHLDLATPNWYGKTISVFLGGEDGVLREAPGSPLTGFPAPTALDAADLTGDGKIDLALGNDDSSTIQILAGDGKGGFAASGELRADGFCFAPVLEDLTGDGRTDVVATACNGARTFSYWINLGGGRFSSAQPLPCPALASTLCVTDLDGDGRVDLAVGGWNEARTYVWHGEKP
jgi:hypothetical protein